jgi:hypothetical protein
MGIASLPAAAGGVVKSIQRGEATTSGNITITAVDTTKAFVRSLSNAAAGAAASDSAETGTLTPSGGNILQLAGGNRFTRSGSQASYLGTRTFSGGTTTLASKEFGVYLTNSTTLTATGACYWEVVEYA